MEEANVTVWTVGKVRNVKSGIRNVSLRIVPGTVVVEKVFAFVMPGGMENIVRNVSCNVLGRKIEKKNIKIGQNIFQNFSIYLERHKKFQFFGNILVQQCGLLAFFTHVYL